MSQYVCVRHLQASKTTKLAAFFLCQKCVKDLTEQAFNGNGPVFEGYSLNGYCNLCAEYQKVGLRQWFLCDNCERMIRSYPLGRAAQNYVLKWWREHIPQLKLINTDPIVLSPYIHPRRKMKRPSNPDFIAIDANQQKQLMIEVKTGRSSISEMSSFQLDFSDCDDILEFVRRELLPTYMFHVQIAEEFSPPTGYFTARNMWWIDIFKMEKCFERAVKRRINRGKQAAYYNRKCFQDMTSFANHVIQKEYIDLRKLLQQRIPALYRLA